jgi:hypothetical protein
MDRARVAVLAAMTAAALALAACGSVASSDGAGAPPTSTTRPKLVLAATGQPVGTAAGAPSADAAMPALFPWRSTRLELSAALPDLGATAVVRRMRAHTVTQGDVRRFAAALGLAGTPVRSANGWTVIGARGTLSFFVSDGDVRVSYEPGMPGAVAGSGAGGSSGGGSTGVMPLEPPVGVVDPGGPIKIAPVKPPVPVPTPAPTPSPTTVAAQPSPPVDVPNAAAAEKAARALLGGLGVLAGQNWSAATVDDSGSLAFACAPGLACPDTRPQVTARTVTFSLLVDGARVDGIDWSVTLGEHSVVESLDGEWVTPDAIGSYPLRSTAAVFADLQHGTARHAGPQPMVPLIGRNAGGLGIGSPATSLPSSPPASSVQITGVSRGVARWDASENGRTVIDLVPTYRFHTRVGGAASADIEVLALDPAAATFAQPVPSRVPTPGKPLPGGAVPASPGAVEPATPAP